MEGFFKIVSRLSRFIFWVAGAILFVMMMLTVVDVILRYMGKSVAGTYELVSFAGALTVGFAIAQTSLDGGHVYVDLLTDRVGPVWRKVLIFCTKLAGALVFLLLAWSFILKGNELYESQEVSMTLHIPFYPVAYGLCACSIIETFVLLSEAIKAVFFPVNGANIAEVKK
jgi:TRAP-type C4-dicarboxylate transport system, small permease component